MRRVRIAGVIFDTDGVITKTASAHFAAWKQVFDDLLMRHDGADQRAFDDADYRRYVDGRDRYSGVAAFLESRGIDLPSGSPDDPPGDETVSAIGNRKNAAFLDHVQHEGVEAFGSTVRLIGELREHGIATAAISASRNAATVLEAAGLSGLFDARVDGLDATALGLASKPEPDLFVEAARRLGVAPGEAAVVEDAVAGVEAGRRGEFGLVIGVDRTRHPAELARFADLVVPDLADLEWSGDSLTRSVRPSSPLRSLSSALEDPQVGRLLEGRRLALLLDYDGTLTPIVERPADARIPDRIRGALADLAALLTVGIISGRDLDDVRAMVGVDGLWYAGSHGFDVVSPTGARRQFDEGTAALPALEQADAALRQLVAELAGVAVERKRFAIAVHFRAADPSVEPRLEELVRHEADAHPELRMAGGKKIFELRPAADWDKGKALEWVLSAATDDDASVLPIYIGDDETDEDALLVVRRTGVGIVVGDEERPTAAHYRLDDPSQVGDFLDRLLDLVGTSE